MRLLHVGKYLPPYHGGVENFVFDLAQAQAERGDAVAVLAHRQIHSPRAAELPRQISVYEAISYGQLLYAPVSPGFGHRLTDAIMQHQPDLLHLHLPNPSAFAALISAEARRLPWVIHWHSDVAVPASKRLLRAAYHLYRRAEAALLRRAAMIVATSPNYLATSRALAPWRDKAITVPLGIDPARLQACSDHGDRLAGYDKQRTLWGDGDLRVLALGRLSHYKGHRHLIQALARLPEDVSLLIVGDGEERTRLVRQIQALGLQRRVALLGSRPQAEVNALLASCDLVCLPSIERSEAFGLVLIEAMIHAKPVIATGVPGSGMRWVLDTAGHGELVPPADSAALAAAIQRLGDRAYAQALGDRGRAAFERRFHIARVADALEDHYLDLLDRLSRTPQP